LKIFWPHRSNANGFSIQKLARDYRLKISSESADDESNQNLENNKSKIIPNNVNNISVVNLSSKRIHWANRDFSEYKKAA
tara:strand:+ start:413 stop:652 length:240 start_codon:yes stop_codon:yes gene_type:complete